MKINYCNTSDPLFEVIILEHQLKIPKGYDPRILKPSSAVLQHVYSKCLSNYLALEEIFSSSAKKVGTKGEGVKTLSTISVIALLKGPPKNL